MAAHGRYSLLRKIAEGGTAEVFLAHQLGSAGFRRLVVLKRVRPSLWADESFRRMLLDEAHISMALHHSNIAQVLDLGASGPHYFLVFELVDGWSLSQVVKRARAAGMELPLNLALHVMAQVCRALAYAHARAEGGVAMGIVHRDISPQNVLLSEQGEVKLADFGIAKARSRISTSQIGQVKGKPAYMSPEQAVGAELDARSDLFSTGTCLYWLATGELPFTAPNELEAIARVVHGKFVPPEKKRPGLPKSVAKLITRALQHEVKDRFQSADELLAELERIQRSKVLDPAGQTELKAWLAGLAAKDGARPIGWVEASVEVAAPGPGGDVSEEIELVDDGDLVVAATQPSDAVAQGVQPPPLPGAAARAGARPSSRSWRRTLVAGGVAAGVVAGVAYWATRGQAPAQERRQEGSTRLEAGAAVRPEGPRAPETGPLASSSMPSPAAGPGTVVPEDGGGPDAGATEDAGAEVGVSVDGGDRADGGGGGELDGGAESDGGHLVGGGMIDGGLGSPSEVLDLTSGRPRDAGLEVRGETSDAGANRPLISSPPPAAVPSAKRPPAVPPPRTAPSGKPGEGTKLPAKPSGAVKPKPTGSVAGEMVSVLVDSAPAGADVSIERKVFGKTPIPLRLRVGITFELVLTKPGFRTQKVLYQVTGRQGQRVRVSLSRY